MYGRLKRYLKGFPPAVAIHRLITRADWWLRDVRSAYLSRSINFHMTPHGFKLTGTNSIHHLAMQKGTFEPEETLLFKDIFQGADVFVDVGANIGYYSCLARSSALHVIAIEPLAKNLESVRQLLSQQLGGYRSCSSWIRRVARPGYVIRRIQYRCVLDKTLGRCITAISSGYSIVHIGYSVGQSICRKAGIHQDRCRRRRISCSSGGNRRDGFAAQADMGGGDLSE